MNGLRLRRAGLALLSALLVLLAAVAANVIGIHLAGGIDDWQAWLTAHSTYFLTWRLLLYAGTAYGWIWMRRRVLAREPDAGTRRRLLRAELAAVVAVAALELSPYLQAG
ncbi:MULTISPECIES: hypothetical protein [Pseudomonas aeruginosa group]|jgi:hypothetical protein|uniref:hypothetical protein n=1 Tax=Pseudomonas aeruginosa group TaxID=136841 RepID=UPI0006652AD1|nr:MULTISPECIES: hypothetical protein [Pseudomonas aeruginosa group]MBG6882718.1 hypothetical protein [Pseudomonas aeruginosa]MBV5858636.1 hypothetical protein [Pseudomonas aeruginosa]MCS7968179.1 hypothetical protein [Pseudomonas aeruginosa]MCS8138422.1 hypothetical protein [Pseudomonas aeruginosa]MCS8180757.1 hypothetical protein [Pseudomonas aeruginosa]